MSFHGHEKSMAKEMVRRGMKKHGSHEGKSRKIVEAAFREVRKDEPSTVTRAKHFGSGGKEAMLRAIALSKARKAGAHIPKPRG